MDRVFEIGRVFRNEGVSVKHSPEFTMLEAYQAYTDYRGMMELVRSMIQKVCAEVLGTTTVVRPDGVAIELGGQWREAKYKDLILERTGDPQLVRAHRGGEDRRLQGPRPPRAAR
jgi:lysyl-tRNA synthetase class 2